MFSQLNSIYPILLLIFITYFILILLLITTIKTDRAKKLQEKIRLEGYYGKYRNKEYYFNFNNHRDQKLFYLLKKSVFNKNKNKEYRYIEKPVTDLSEISYKKTEGSYKGIRGNIFPVSEKEKTVKLEFSVKKNLSKEELEDLIKKDFKSIKKGTYFKDIPIRELNGLWEIKEELDLKIKEVGNKENYYYLERKKPGTAIEIDLLKRRKKKEIYFHQKQFQEDQGEMKFSSIKERVGISEPKISIVKNYITTTRGAEGEADIVIPGNYGLYQGIECLFTEYHSNKARLLTTNPLAGSLGFEKQKNNDSYVKFVPLKEVKDMHKVYNEGEYKGQRGKITRAYTDYSMIKFISKGREQKIAIEDFDKIWEVRETLIPLEKGYDHRGNIIYDIRIKTWIAKDEILIKEKNIA